jgi:hypothetical protein
MRTLPRRKPETIGLSDVSGGADCNFTPAMSDALNCYANCAGQDVNVTSGVRNGQQNQHGQGTAADIGRGANPNLNRATAERCHASCFSDGHGQEERNGVGNNAGTHFHEQLRTIPGARPNFSPGIVPYDPHP